MVVLKNHVARHARAMCGAIMGGVIDVRCYLQTKMMFFAG